MPGNLWKTALRTQERKRGKMQTISEYYHAHGTDLTNPLKEASLNHTTVRCYADLVTKYKYCHFNGKLTPLTTILGSQV